MSSPQAGIAIFSLLSCFLLLPRTAGAIEITVDAYDSGWIETTEYHITTIENYSAGNSDVNGWYFRNFFRFDLTGISDGVTSAVLRIHLGTSNSGDLSETYEVFDAPSLIFANLGSGTSYGSREIFMTETGTADIELNAAAIAAINAALGGLFDVGGYVNSLDADDFTNETLFGNTTSSSTRQLILNPIPEPTTALLLGVGLAGLARYRRRSG